VGNNLGDVGGPLDDQGAILFSSTRMAAQPGMEAKVGHFDEEIVAAESPQLHFFLFFDSVLQKEINVGGQDGFSRYQRSRSLELAL